MTPPSDFALLVFTLGTAALATLVIMPFGILAGGWLARGRGPARTLVETVFLLPLVLPPTAVGLLLLLLLRRDGMVGQVLEGLGVEVLFTWKAVVVASAVMAFPLLVRASRDALAEVDPRLVAMARSLGEPPLRAFVRVGLPLAWRGILGGTLLAFARALGEFGATILVAGNIPHRTQTLSLAIFQRVEAGEDGSAWGLVGWTVALAFGALLVTERIQRRQARKERA